MNEEELGDIPVPELDLFLFKGGPDACTFLSHDASLLRRGLARPHRPNKLAQLDRHGVTSANTNTHTKQTGSTTSSPIPPPAAAAAVVAFATDV